MISLIIGTERKYYLNKACFTTIIQIVAEFSTILYILETIRTFRCCSSEFSGRAECGRRIKGASQLRLALVAASAHFPYKSLPSTCHCSASALQYVCFQPPSTSYSACSVRQRRDAFIEWNTIAQAALHTISYFITTYNMSSQIIRDFKF